MPRNHKGIYGSNQNKNKTYANNDYIEVEVIYEVLENIGSKDKILF